MVHSNFALIIRSLDVWNIYTATLFHVEEHEFYFTPTGKVEAAEVSTDEALSKLVEICTQCELKVLYDTLGKKNFKTESLFWAKADKQMQHYVKQQTDKRLNTILEITSRLGIHLFFRESSKNELLKKNELSPTTSVAVPQMIFRRSEEGIDYTLHLKLSEEEVIEEISEALQFLSERRAGAILVIARSDRFEFDTNSGKMINGNVSAKLIESIFSNVLEEKYKTASTFN